MREVLKRLEDLRNLSGNAQISYLNSVKTPLLREVLEYTYDTHKKYKINELKYDRATMPMLNTTLANFDMNVELTIDLWNAFKELLDYLADIKSATDEDVQRVKNFIEPCAERDFLKMVLFKDLRINMNKSKFQKVWSDFLVEPQVQLAKSKEDRADFKNNRFSRKFDGKRLYIKSLQPYSRENNLCYKNPISHILNQVEILLGDDKDKVVLDGECLYFEDGKENFQKGISLCQSEERKEGCDNICYVIFDMQPTENFMTKSPWISFEEEYKLMCEKFSKADAFTPDYSLIPTSQPNIFIARQDDNPDALMKLYKEKGWEGIMQRNADVPYEFKRTTNLLKIKAMDDTEVTLTDMEEGTGKFVGTLGAFIADYQGNRLKIGSGFSDEQRQEYWNNKDKYIGQTVKVQYFEKTKNQDGTDSLRFPVFLCFRNLKTDEEYLSII